MRNRQFEFSLKTLFARAAERNEAASSDLRCPIWLRGQGSNLGHPR